MTMAGTISGLLCRQLRPCIRKLRSNQTLKLDVLKFHFQCYRYSTRQTKQMPKLRQPAQNRGSDTSGYPLLIIPLTCVGLGIWQIQRKSWKEGVIKQLEDKLEKQPIPLPGDLEELCHKGMEYTRVILKGTFDHSRELFIGPRSNINYHSSKPDPNESMGVFVVTPFKLSDRDETILVNRGHVTFKNQPQEKRQAGQVEGEVVLAGVVRLTEQKNMMSGTRQAEGTWLSRDIEDMANYAQTYPLFVDADIQSSVPGGPNGGQTRVVIRNEHLTYIFTWFSLAAFTFWLWQRNNKMVKLGRK